MRERGGREGGERGGRRGEGRGVSGGGETLTTCAAGESMNPGSITKSLHTDTTMSYNDHLSHYS